MSENYYRILGVPADATAGDIKRAYRRLVKEYHPDHHGGRSGPFRSIHQAYSVLRDPVQRRKYDRSLRSRQPRIRTEAPSGPDPFGMPVEPLRPVREFSSAPHRRRPRFPASFGTFTGMAEELRGGFAARRQREDNAARAVEVHITPIQATHGGRVRVTAPAAGRCPRCSGRGGRGIHPCGYCGGDGIAARYVPVLLRFPAGIRDGDTASLSLDLPDVAGAFLTVRFRIRPLP